ncbi:hypothetical protein ACFQS2_07995 [Brachybacterium sp. GCM10030267]|uniref:hypothetical protein n=1 Tax=Brachybacterium sp. GCM10030267 TaxID=3273381 RepID=UPI00360E6FEA
MVDAQFPRSARRRPLWHWLLAAGIAAVGLVIVGLFAVIIAWQVLTRGNPQSTLEDFYSSLQSGDCELFEDSTTQEYRESTGLTSCEVFEETVGGMSGIDYEVTERTNRQGYAIFDVTETYTVDGRDTEVQLQYFVRRTDGQWDLDGIRLVEPGDDPIT